ncbi:stage III sporulation protein AG [Virgibacillus sp. YIM 98842]|uniref:stage III sporulation protein AG n=1 Tax=Virgibacillus sp. YIM 98842 TaxID=2663533 RepID=UPI0013D99970|nr:stage III sporulation protein AG [Virgibacillus sp. YIM 98842]
MKRFFEKFFSSDKTDPKQKNTSKKAGYILVLALTGLLLIILGNIFSSSSSDSNNEMELQPQIDNDDMEQQSAQAGSEEADVTSDMQELEGIYKKELEEMLNKVQGVSEAEVMVNLDSTNVKVYEKNLIKGQQTTDESDQNGGTRKVEDHTEEAQTVLVRQGDREVPLLVETKKPEVRGVFVVANGADHASVRSWIVEAVSRVLDVPTHRVSVMPKN